MNDEELRSLIRAAIQRQLGGPASVSAPSAVQPELRRGPLVSLSFDQYRLERAADDTMCVIEPAASCNHCGFCKCHGH